MAVNQSCQHFAACNQGSSNVFIRTWRDWFHFQGTFCRIGESWQLRRKPTKPINQGGLDISQHSKQEMSLKLHIYFFFFFSTDGNTYTQNGSYPSCRPQTVKYFSEFKSWPKQSFACSPQANVKAGTKPSPISMSLKAVSLPHTSVKYSPFKVKLIALSVRSSMQPITSFSRHVLPKFSDPLCHLRAWKGNYTNWITACSPGLYQWYHSKLLLTSVKSLKK